MTYSNSPVFYMCIAARPKMIATPYERRTTDVMTVSKVTNVNHAVSSKRISTRLISCFFFLSFLVLIFYAACTMVNITKSTVGSGSGGGGGGGGMKNLISSLSSADVRSLKQYGVLFLVAASFYWFGYQQRGAIAIQEQQVDVGGRKIVTSVNDMDPTTSDGPRYLDDIRPHYLEDLMYHYGSDKSHDDHAYTDMYQMIFNPIRRKVSHVMEVGVSAGQSIQAWYHYFPNAKIHAFDVVTLPSIPKVVQKLNDRVIFHETDLLGKDYVSSSGGMDYSKVGLHNNSIDVLIEDGNHRPWQQHDFLVKLFPLLKPGGIYVSEDIEMFSEGGKPPRGRGWQLDQVPSNVREILHTNDAIFVDTHIGHRDWKEWMKRSGKYAQNHTFHNSYLLVIRKRVTPARPLQMNVKVFAMNPDKVILDDPKVVEG